MKHIKKFILTEGVADRYASDKFYLPEPHEDFELGYRKSNLKELEPIGYVTQSLGKDVNPPIPIFKNPNDLTNFPPYVRGIITRNGDLYLTGRNTFTVENESALIKKYTFHVYHADIIEVLKDKKILGIGMGFDYFEASEDMDLLAIQRKKDLNILAIAESVSYDRSGYKYFVPFLKGAKSKNPNINFVNKPSK